MENENQTYTNPSIGRIGEMYFDERNNRIKFFSTQLHHSQSSIDGWMEEGRERMRRSGATRLNARFFTSFPVQEYAEACIPFNNENQRIYLNYLGINAPSRQDTQEVINAENALLERVLRTPSRVYRGRHSLGRPENDPVYLLQRLNSQKVTSQDIRQIEQIFHEAFTTCPVELDETSIRKMIDNSGFFVARQVCNWQIDSIAVGEIANIDTDFGNFSICEFSKMATRRTRRGLGISSWLTGELAEHIRDRVNLVYAETRACHEPINHVFRNLGFSYAGRLSKQCVLSGDSEVSESGPYQNLNVWYILPREH